MGDSYGEVMADFIISQLSRAIVSKGGNRFLEKWR